MQLSGWPQIIEWFWCKVIQLSFCHRLCQQIKDKTQRLRALELWIWRKLESIKWKDMKRNEQVVYWVRWEREREREKINSGNKFSKLNLFPLCHMLACKQVTSYLFMWSIIRGRVFVINRLSVQIFVAILVSNMY